MRLLSMTTLRASRRRRVLSPRLLVVVAGSILLACVALLRSPSTLEQFTRNPLDNSWLVSLPAMLQQGAISGRDFFYTYGPLAQILAGIGVWLNGGASALDAFFAISFVFRLTSVVLAALWLMLIKPLTWRQLAGMLVAFGLLNVLNHLFAFRMLLVLIGMTLLYRGLSSSDISRQRQWAVLTGSMCLVNQLVTVELGLQTIFSSMLVLVVYALCARFPSILRRNDLASPRHYLSILGIVAGTYLFGNLLISLLFKLSSPVYSGLFDYQVYNLEILRGYNNTMGAPWLPPPTFLVGLFIVVLYVSVFIVWNLRRFETPIGYLLLGHLIAAWISFKGMLLRGDWGHVTLSLVPLILLLLLLGHDWLKRGRLTLVRAAWVGALLILISIWPVVNWSAPIQLLQALAGAPPLGDKLAQITTQRWALDEIMPGGLVNAANGMSGALLNFPYENYIGVGLNRKLVAPVLQAHIAHTGALQQKYIDMLSAQTNLFDVMYGLDYTATWPVDDVQHVTRVPIIFDYLYRNFELQSTQKFGAGFYLLRPRTRPAELRAEVLSFTSEAGDAAHMTLRLDQPATCSLVRLFIMIRYPLTSLMGRPNALQLQFSFDGQVQHQSSLVAIETGRPFATYVSLIDAERFYEVFGSTLVQTKFWDALDISPRASGAFEVSPSAVEISKLECIHIENAAD